MGPAGWGFRRGLPRLRGVPAPASESSSVDEAESERWLRPATRALCRIVSVRSSWASMWRMDGRRRWYERWSSVETVGSSSLVVLLSASDEGGGPSSSLVLSLVLSSLGSSIPGGDDGSRGSISEFSSRGGTGLEGVSIEGCTGTCLVWCCLRRWRRRNRCLASRRTVAPSSSCSSVLGSLSSFLRSVNASFSSVSSLKSPSPGTCFSCSGQAVHALGGAQTATCPATCRSSWSSSRVSARCSEGWMIAPSTREETHAHLRLPASQ